MWGLRTRSRQLRPPAGHVGLQEASPSRDRGSECGGEALALTRPAPGRTPWQASEGATLCWGVSRIQGPVPNTREAPCAQLPPAAGHRPQAHLPGGPRAHPSPPGASVSGEVGGRGAAPCLTSPWPARHCTADPKPILFSCTMGHHCPPPSAGREDSVKELARVGAGDSMCEQAGDTHGRRGLRSGAETRAAGPMRRGQ